MRTRELIDRLLNVGTPGFILRHEPSISAAQVTSLVQSPNVVVALLRSDHLTPSDGQIIQDILLSGNVLMLGVAPNARELPGQLLKAWVGYVEDAFTNTGPSIRFNPHRSPLQVQGRRNGILVLIVPNDYAGIIESRFRSQSYRVPNEDVGTGEQSSRQVHYTFGLPVETVTVKDLCFLHHRDRTPTYERPVRDILSSGEAITWRDLQTLLKEQPDRDMLRILEQRHNMRQLSDTQLGVAYEAVSVLRRERGERDISLNGIGVEKNIYHLLWFNSWLQKSNRYVFRGQRDTRWRQETTLTRAWGGNPATLKVILDRLNLTQAFLNELANHELTTHLNDDQKLAIAQHYGMPTPLLDYTRSMEIAAFFATGCGNLPPQSDQDIGVIYYVGADKPLAEPAVSNAVDFTKEAGFQFGELTSIEVPLSEQNNRIARQQGVFIRGFDSNDLQRLRSGVLYFRHESNEAYVDDSMGITPEDLLNPDEVLQQLADRLKDASTSDAIPLTLSPVLSSVKWPSDNLFGSLGLSLLANLTNAQNFLNELVTEAENVESELAEKLRNILIHHFSAARIAARTAEVGAPTPQGDATEELIRSPVDDIPDDVDDSISQLAHLADIEPVAFLRRFRNLRPYFQNHEDDPLLTPPESSMKGIAEAAALFIIGLEHLRIVRGDVSMKLFSRARLRLGENQRFAIHDATGNGIDVD
jgi:hypothetical protein